MDTKDFDRYSHYYQANQEEKMSVIVEEDIEYYETSIDECILLEYKKIERNKADHFNTKLLLTNQCIVCIEKRSVGFFKSKYYLYRYPLSEIKLYNEVPMVSMQRDDDEKYLTVQLKDGSIEQYRADDHNSRFIKTMIREINRLFQVPGYEHDDVFSRIKYELDENDDLKEVVEAVGSSVKVIGSSLFQALNQHTNKTQPTRSMSIEEQAETLKHLKALLDAGILTQEEFDRKKKEIMNL